jgi:hypothetical protein
MNCNECSNLLDDYIEEELDTKNSVLMETHLSSCTNCARNFRELKTEQNLYAHYLTNVEAKPQLWIDLQEKLEKAQSPGYRQPLAYFQNLFANNFRGFYPNQLQVAALAVVAVFGVIGFIKYEFSGNPAKQKYATHQENLINENQPSKNEIVNLDHNRDADLMLDVTPSSRRLSGGHLARRVSARRAQDSQPEAGASVFPNFQSRFRRENRITVPKIINPTRRQPTDEVVQKVERQYVNAIAVLRRDIERQRGEKLSYDALLQAKTALTDLDRTIENTRRAVREQPGDPVAIQYMTTAYAKKIELLREIGSN